MIQQKTYSAPGKFNITIGSEMISFNGIDVPHKRRTYTTKDPKKQQKLEDTEAFGSLFTLDKVIDLEEKTITNTSPDENKEETTEVPQEEEIIVKEEEEELVESTGGKELKAKKVETLADAKKWIARDLEEKVYPSMTKAKACEIARKKGYDLIIG